MATKESEHTKGKADYRDSSDRIIIVGGENRDYICTVQIRQTWGGAIAESMEDIRKANAKRLILCWNSHDKLTEQRDKLLAVCEDVTQMCLGEPMNKKTIAKAKAAIAAKE